MIPIHHIQSVLNELSDKLAIYLPLANCHMVDFITFNLWDKVLPCTLAEDLENIAIEDLYKIMFPQEGLLDHLQGIQGQFPHLHEFISAVHALQLGQLGVLSTKSQVYEWLELEAEREVERVSLGRLMRHQKTHEVEEMSQLIATLCQELQLSWVCDLGAGKGYLSSVLARHYKVNVLAVDCVLSNVTAAQSYQKILQKELNHQQKLKTKRKTNKTSDKDHQFELIQEQDTSSIFLDTAQEGKNALGATTPSSLNEIKPNTTCQDRSASQEVQRTTLSLDRSRPLKEGNDKEEAASVLDFNDPLVGEVEMSETSPVNTDAVTPITAISSPEMNGVLGGSHPDHIALNCELSSCPLKRNIELSGLYLCVAKYISKDVQLLEVLHEAINSHCSHISNSVSSVSPTPSTSLLSSANPVSSVSPTPSTSLLSSANPVSSVSPTPSTSLLSSANPVSSVFPTPYASLPLPRLLVSGLHTCGDLACAGVKAFARDASVAALCAVGCCYHLLTEAFEGDAQAGMGDTHAAGVEGDRQNVGIACDSKKGYGVVTNGDRLANTDDWEKNFAETVTDCGDAEKVNFKADGTKQDAVTAAFTSYNSEEGVVDGEKIRQQSHDSSPSGDASPAGFPMSSCLLKKRYSLGRNARMIAAQPPARLSHSTSHDSSQSQFWRALLQLVIVSKLHEAAVGSGRQETSRQNERSQTLREERCSPTDRSQEQDRGKLSKSGKISSVVHHMEFEKVDPNSGDHQMESNIRRPIFVDNVVKCPCTLSTTVSSQCQPVDGSKKSSKTTRGIGVKPSSKLLNFTTEALQYNTSPSAVKTSLTDESKPICECYSSASARTNDSLSYNTSPCTHQSPTTFTSDSIPELKQEALSVDECYSSASARTNDSLSYNTSPCTHQSPTTFTSDSIPELKQEALSVDECYSSASARTNDSLSYNTSPCTHQSPTTFTSDSIPELKQEALSVDAAHPVQPSRGPLSSAETASPPSDYSAFQHCCCPARVADREDLTAYRVGRRLASHCTSFEEYAAKAVEKLPATLRGRVQVGREQLRTLERRHRGDGDRLAKLFLLRASLGPAIEGLVLLDRLAFLLQQDCCRSAFLLPLFDPVLSPRCFALLAFKQTS